MDASALLVLPCSSVVAFVTMLWFAIAGDPAPRLIWPCGFSTFVAAMIFLRVPTASTMPVWVFALMGMAFSAAIGTVIGAAMARLGIAASRKLKRRQG